MKFGKKQKRLSFKRTWFLKLYFIAGSLIIVLIILLYTNSLLRNIQKDVQIVPDLYSKFIGLPADVNLESFLFQYFMTEIFPNIEYPIILADSMKVPYSWENIDIEKKSFSLLSARDQKKLQRYLKHFEKQKAVIPLKYNMESDQIISYVYFGESSTMRQLRWLPYVEFITVIIFVILGIYGLMSIKKNEENMLWVGLAKETAHQFGSPLSSLMGWCDMLEFKLADMQDKPELLNMLDSIRFDIERLNKIASRFGKVGSIIKKQSVDMHALIWETLKYFQLRLPSHSKEVKLNFVSKIEGQKFMVDPDLIKWTLENLIKNALDAIRNNGGEITVSAFSYHGQLYIHVRDDGKGIQKSMFKRIFQPGITTKERGWGLGLSLAKRIIEDYHQGNIRVLDSGLNQGTTIEITLPEV